MNSAKMLRVAGWLFIIASLTTKLQGAAQQEVNPSEGETLHVLVGKSVLINVQAPMTRVLSSSPAVVETLVISPTQIVVEGKAAGASSLILWDGPGHSQILDVIVDLDVSGLRAAIQRAYPNEQLDVQADGGRLILTGSVADPRLIDDLAKMAAPYSNQVVNSVTVPVSHDRQVLLEVKFAEVDRTKLQQLGINFFSTGAANTVGTVSTQQFGPPSLTDVTGTIGAPAAGTATGFKFPDLLNVFLFRPDLNLGVTIRALEQKSILQILAEPNLMAMNGQKASFLAGGEFPFPVVQGGANVGAVTVQFRPFGVRLEFTGYIGRDNVIRLHVAPEVSTLDFTNALTIQGFTIPALSTRRAESEIELRDGQSFGIAGLLDHRAVVQMSKVPGLGDIPIIGQLFRSRSINRSNDELLVLVTPHIIDPVRSALPIPPLPKVVVPYLDDEKFDRKAPEQPKNAETPPQTPSPK
jgi:pilus assembly protein CpaC